MSEHNSVDQGGSESRRPLRSRFQFRLSTLLLLLTLALILLVFCRAVAVTVTEPYSIITASFSRNDKLLARNNGRGFGIFDLERQRRVLRLNAAGTTAFSHDSTLLASVHHGAVRLWDIWSQKKLPPLVIGDERVRTIAFADRDETLILVKDDGVERWDIRDQTLQQVVRLSIPEDAANLVVADDGFTLAYSTTKDVRKGNVVESTYDIFSWNLRNGARNPTLAKLKSNYIGPLVISRDGKLLAFVANLDSGAVVQIWDIDRGKQLHAIKLDNSTFPLAFLADSSTLAIFYYGYRSNNILHTWDFTASTLHSARFPWTESTCAEAISADGRTLTMAGHRGTVSRWNVATGTLSEQIRGMELPGPVPSLLWYILAGCGAAWVISWVGLERRISQPPSTGNRKDFSCVLVLFVFALTVINGTIVLSIWHYSEDSLPRIIHEGRVE